MLRSLTLASAVSLALLTAGCKQQAAVVDDPTLMSNIQQKISSDSALSKEAIQVYVQQGAATLNGQVSSDAARSLAANDAASITGITKVINNLVVGPTPSATAVARATGPISSVTTPARREVAREKVQRQPAPVLRDQAPSQPSMSRNNPPPAPAPVVPAGPVYRNVTLPSGSTIPVRVTTALDSATTQTGDAFAGTIASDVIQDGMVVLPRGSVVTGRVVEAREASHFKGNSGLTVELTGITRKGDRIPLTTESYTVEGKGRGASTATKAGVGAAAGAILGGIFGGGKGAAIGAAAGGGTGLGINAITRGQQVQIPSESVVRFRLSNAISVRTSTTADSSQGDPTLQNRN